MLSHPSWLAFYNPVLTYNNGIPPSVVTERESFRGIYLIDVCEPCRTVIV